MSLGLTEELCTDCVFLLPISSFIGGPNQHSVLWNAMIYPFLNMTIKGAIWYQGEANARMDMLP